MEQQKNTTEKKDEPKAITFAEFLMNTPPMKLQKVSDLCIIDKRLEDVLNTPFADIPRIINTPPLTLYCGNVSCNGNRSFEFFNKEGDLNTDSSMHKFLIEYRCCNCKKYIKTYPIFAHSGVVGRHHQDYNVLKIGEYPPFGPRIPKQILKLIKTDKELFSKGFRAENQGLGIGAFSYYRRVVENQKNHLFDQIIKVSKKLKAENEIIEDLQKAKKMTQFDSAVEKLKLAIPEALLIDGHHNPLKLLHKALSIGIHNKNDDECLELAHDIRKVLTELSERLGQALKEDKDLKKSVGRLLNLKKSKT